MKATLKPFFLLSALVLTIYVMRQGDTSFGSLVKRVLDTYTFPDQLPEIRPSATLCKGTSLSQVYTQSEIDRAESFKKSLQGMRGGNPMKDLLLNEPMDADSFISYFKGALAFIVPWAVMFILSIISAIVITCNWCCIYGCCKNAKCCKCCKEPKNSSKKRIYVFISAIFALAGIGSGIAGIIMASGVPKGIELTMCSVIALAEDLAYGVPTEHWLGISGAYYAIDDLRKQFVDIKNNLTQSATSPSPTPIETARDNVLLQLNSMKSTLENPANGNKDLLRPDQTQSPNTYTPIFIANLSSTDVEYSPTLMIQEEVNTRYTIITTAQSDINSAIDSIQTQATAVENAIGDGQNEVYKYYNITEDALDNVNDYGSIGKAAITGIGAGLTAIFAATLTFSIFAVGAMIMVGFLKMKSFNKFLHSSWMGFTLMSILGFLLSTILYPLSLVLMETCDVLQLALTDDTGDTMNQLLGNALEDNEVGDIIYLCMFGDGDLIKYFNLDTTLGDFKTINDQFAAIEGDMPFDGSLPPCYTLQYEYYLADAFKSGTLLDADETINDLSTLNQKVIACPSSDLWMDNSVNCTADKGTSFTSSMGDTDNFGSPTCIGFDAWTVPPHSTLNRYSSCAASADIDTLVANFKQNRIDVTGVFTRVKNELDQVDSKYQVFATETKNIIDDVLHIKDELYAVEGSLYDNTTGLFRNMNCNFIGDGIRRVSDSMCVGFIGSLYQASVVIIICSVMAFFGAIFVFCLAKRFILQDPNTKPKPV